MPGRARASPLRRVVPCRPFALPHIRMVALQQCQGESNNLADTGQLELGVTTGGVVAGPCLAISSSDSRRPFSFHTSMSLAVRLELGLGPGFSGTTRGPTSRHGPTRRLACRASPARGPVPCRHLVCNNRKFNESCRILDGCLRSILWELVELHVHFVKTP